MVVDDRRLSLDAQRVLEDGDNRLFLSIASAWELSIKVGLGKLSLAGGPLGFFRKHLAINNVELLPVELEHVVKVSDLLHHHRDPFDRLLIAQARVEGMPLVTRDPRISRYPVDVVW